MTGISFEGRVAIVTGAGGGIGRAHALELGRRGCAVVVNDLGGDVAGRGGSGSMAESVAGEIVEAGGRAIANHDSVADPAAAVRIVQAALGGFGRIDILINNAGNLRNASLDTLADDDWNALLSTHLTGSYSMARAVWPHMKAQQYGRLVFTSSSSGLFGTAMQVGYAAAKAGIIGLMNIAAIEGEAHGILANAVMPNADSRMARQTMADWGAEKQEQGAALMASAIGNSMNPEFNTPLAVFLASEACSSTHAIYSQCLGRVARVFVGAARGWQGGREAPPTLEDIAAHWEEICDLSSGFATPVSSSDEFATVLAQD